MNSTTKYGNRWEDHEEQTIKLLWEEYTDKELGEILERCEGGVKKARCKLGLKRARCGIISDEADEIMQLYTKEGLSIIELAKRYKSKESTISKFLNGKNAKRKLKGDLLTDEDKVRIAELCVYNNWSASEIAAEMRTSYFSVRKVLKDFDLFEGRRTIKIGDKFGRWTVKELYKIGEYNSAGCNDWLCVCDCGIKRVVNGRSLLRGRSRSCGCIRTKLKENWNGKFVGNRRLNKCGYIEIYEPDNPNSNCHGIVLEHRKVMSEYKKRPLMANEYVHHKNGVKIDNRIENLELWSESHPPGQRESDMIDFCTQYLREHQPNMLIGYKEPLETTLSFLSVAHRPDEACGKGTILHFEDGFNVRDFWKDAGAVQAD